MAPVYGHVRDAEDLNQHERKNVFHLRLDGIEVRWWNSSPRVEGILALVLATLFVVFMCIEPGPRRYAHAFFAIIGIGIAMQRFGVLRKKA